MSYPFETDGLNYELTGETDLTAGALSHTLSFAFPRRRGTYRGNVVLMPDANTLLFYDGIADTITNTVDVTGLVIDSFFALGEHEATADLWLVDNSTWPPVAQVYDVASWTLKRTVTFDYTRYGHSTDGVYGAQMYGDHIYLVADGVSPGGATPWPVVYKIPLASIDMTASTLEITDPGIAELPVSAENAENWVNIALYGGYIVGAVHRIDSIDGHFTDWVFMDDPTDATTADYWSYYQSGYETGFAALQMSDGVLGLEQDDANSTTKVTVWGTHTKPVAPTVPFWTDFHNTSEIT